MAKLTEAQADLWASTESRHGWPPLAQGFWNRAFELCGWLGGLQAEVAPSSWGTAVGFIGFVDRVHRV